MASVPEILWEIDNLVNPDSDFRHPQYRNLHQIAWRNKDRTALFEDVVGSEQYKSLKLVFQYTDHDRHQERLLVVSEYKAALSDAKRWFDRQDLPKTKFNQEESYWRPEVSKDEDEGGDQQMDTDEGQMCTDAEPDWPTSSGVQGAFIVCGMPGIGKSCFLYYVLVERLLANLPTCFQTEPNRFTYWCDQGVFLCNMERLYTDFKIPSGVWFLVDSNMTLVSPATVILNSGARVIQAASPRKARLDWIRKRSTFTYMWFMKPSPLRELLIMRKFWPVPPADEEVAKFATDYGPSARLISCSARDLRSYRTQLQKMINGLTTDTLRQLISHPLRLNADDDSHWILGIYPGNERNQSTLGFHTPEIYGLVKAAFSKSWDSHARSMYALFNAVGQTRGSAGFLLEDVLHSNLPMGGYWKVTKLTSKDRKPIKNIKYSTPSSGQPRTEKYLLIASDPDIVEAVPAAFTPLQPLTVYRYDSGDASVSWNNSGYYRPSAPNQATFNSFVVNHTLQYIFVFLFTVSEDHDVNEEGSQFLRKHFSGYRLHYIVFSAHRNIKLSVPIGCKEDWASLWHMHVHVTENAVLSN